MAGAQAGRRVDPHYLSSYREALLAAIHRQLSRPAKPQDRQGVLGLAKNPILRDLLASEGCACACCCCCCCCCCCKGQEWWS